jgi:hypothetical protein
LFRNLAQWRTNASKGEQAPPPKIGLSMKNGHYHPPILDGAARPCRLREGLYQCRVSTMYKLRDCTVSKQSGHTLLEFHDGNLLSLKGVVYDDGPVVRYEAWLTDQSTIVGCKGCEQQPIHGVLRGNGNRFTGLLTFRNYYDPGKLPPLPEADVAIEEADDRFPLTLVFKKASR